MIPSSHMDFSPNFSADVKATLCIIIAYNQITFSSSYSCFHIPFLYWIVMTLVWCKHMRYSHLTYLWRQTELEQSVHHPTHIGGGARHLLKNTFIFILEYSQYIASPVWSQISWLSWQSTVPGCSRYSSLHLIVQFNIPENTEISAENVVFWDSSCKLAASNSELQAFTSLY